MKHILCDITLTQGIKLNIYREHKLRNELDGKKAEGGGRVKNGVGIGGIISALNEYRKKETTRVDKLKRFESWGQ